ncbi:MAG: hypothetical protein CK426_09280 [Legionella sp.]|nr:MAG: hypothetical protein CK426_09280 [Legionella sp.]
MRDTIIDNAINGLFPKSINGYVDKPVIRLRDINREILAFGENGMNAEKSLKTRDQARELIDCFKAELCSSKKDLYDAFNQFDDEALDYLLSNVNGFSLLINEAIKNRK